jgi:alginate O-acetyltransferase complex protein AlgI
MVFSSTVFLFLFLPITLLLYYVAGNRVRNALLLAASLFFYAWGEGLYVLIMLFSIAMNYLFGVLIDRFRFSGKKHAIVTAIAVSANLSLLGFYKYAGFAAENINSLLQSLGQPPFRFQPIHLPIGCFENVRACKNTGNENCCKYNSIQTKSYRI